MPDRYRTSATVAIAVLVGVIIILVIALTTSMRAGVVGLAVFALAGAAARVVVPASAAFAVRRRTVDVSVLLVFGLALAYLGLTTALD
ncbi:MAG: hypothetical protein CVT64_09295 [Actinobacteria bacterium HGW-Actinobacteria-4]|nr:MAG: hypothetical protein CVT64_09295 [Actinobacteria bacterium HGW-Actinobacteria-4]